MCSQSIFFCRYSINSGPVLENNTTYDAWGCIRFQQMDPNVLIYMDRCCLHYFDIRVRNKEISRLIIYYLYKAIITNIRSYYLSALFI